MKANEFIKKFGLFTFELSIGFVNSSKFLVVYEDEIDFTDEIQPYHGKCVYDRREVRNYVIAHKFIDSIGGLAEAKQLIKDARMCSSIHLRNLDIPEFSTAHLKMSIKLVESCL